MFGKKVKANIGEYVKAKTSQGEVKGVLIPFRGRKMIETSAGIQDIQAITDVTPTQKLGHDTKQFVNTVRRRHGL